ncbi:hypothetical protein [Colwellia hornerae]|uniref:Uncharacterized protein n=1 Tax=Colwellia hornerae TaxID=89402 RepID=A0A5C6QEE9_9GAMM|nr:hypothetical protein [Colwellia hornerae]TWX59426.1 hypothetical protein ESZ28_00320 [Colwellia hornerae]TWX62796.1 hypothetical protein ESZ26_00315 [Colwellia hornerae]TWX67110.1 hypothetical protein ESZ27_09555 [Colwellia hornerae]
MVSINKKLWSFNFGCLIAGTFFWLVSFGVSAPISEVFHSYPHFILNYHAGVVTAFTAFLLTGAIIFIMRSFFNVCASEHTFWLMLPSLGFIILAILFSQSILITMLYAAFPALIVMLSSAIMRRIPKYKTLA